MLEKIRKHIISIVESAAEEAVRSGAVNAKNLPPVTLETPRLGNHGDVSSNICFQIGRQNALDPREVSEALLGTSFLSGPDPYIEKIEAAGPGFINFFLKNSAHQMLIPQILCEGEMYGSSPLGEGKKALLEFVSANPTGPLHIGHARNAVVGDVLSRILEFAGYSVRREYYLNDAGRQVDALGRSLKQRYLEASGREYESEPEYRGDYLASIASELLSEDGGRFREHPEGFFVEKAVEKIRRDIRKDLDNFSVAFDSWFSERTLHESGLVQEAARLLVKSGAAEERDGALWFLASRFGDEKDRVIIRKNGAPTYLAADIAYHREKLRSGCDRMINVLGADHHGYVPRLKGVVEALGGAQEMIDVVLIQLVKLTREGKPVPMSTREGEFITLKEVLEEVGSDALRFFMLMRRSDAQLDFDIELAKKHSVENPVYYVQYAHARMASLLKKARESGLQMENPPPQAFTRLREEPEIALAKVLGVFPEVIEGSAKALEPQRLTAYLQEAASKFHNFYDRLRVVGEERNTAEARLLLVAASKTVISNGLRLLGVSCPDEM